MFHHLSLILCQWVGGHQPSCISAWGCLFTCIYTACVCLNGLRVSLQLWFLSLCECVVFIWLSANFLWNYLSKLFLWPDSCLLLGLVGEKHWEGWVSKVRSKAIKKDWLLSLPCEVANCFLIFQKHFLRNVLRSYRGWRQKWNFSLFKAAWKTENPMKKAAFFIPYSLQSWIQKKMKFEFWI